MKHLPHLLIVGLPLVFCAGLVARAWRAEGPARPSVERSSQHGLVLAVAACVLGSGLVHLTVIKEHFQESTLLGAFFVALAVTQLLIAGLVVGRPHRAVLAAVAIGQTAVVGLWGWTRLVGIPFGVAGGQKESVGSADLAATGLELGAVFGALILLSLAARGSAPSSAAPASNG